MQWPLVLAGLAMGVAATPHCAVMCGAPCAALTQGCARSSAGFHAGRLLGYMAAGAVAASSVAALGTWSTAAPALRPLWVLLQLATHASPASPARSGLARRFKGPCCCRRLRTTRKEGRS